ncbi:MAG: hypothetical protein U9R75_11205 [Candidatus Thermoplasmatota archaeon]|nr:hypothetical protein [Candidatus Thermoplasmatota archaeon]
MEINGREIDKKTIQKILKKATKLGYDPGMHLPEKAFKLGFEIGYHGHFEGFGGAGGTLENIAEKASDFGLKKLIMMYYGEGKSVGKSERAFQLTGNEKEDKRSDDISVSRKGRKIDEEEFEVKDTANLTEMPRVQELFQPLEVLPGVTVPKLFKIMSFLK